MPSESFQRLSSSPHLLNEIRLINFKRVLYATSASFIINVCFVAVFFFKKANSTDGSESAWAQSIFLLHVSLAVVNAALLLTALFLFYSNRQQSWWAAALTITDYCFIILWGLAAVLIDQRVTPAINAFVINAIIVAVAFYVKPLTSIVIFSLSFMLFYAGMQQTQANETFLLSNIVNGGAFLLGCMVISAVFWMNKTRSLKQKAIIAAQKEKMEILNGELRERNAAKDKFLSIISHDLRGNVNNSISVAQILCDDKMMPEEDRIYFTQILSTSLLQTAALLENLLLWSKNKTGKLITNPERLSVAELLHYNVALQDAMIKNKNISVKFQFLDQCTVNADREMMNTVFRNLLTNAVKYCNKNGKIEIAVKKEASEVLITICDDGVGMSTNTQKRLFEIEYKTSTEGTGREKGTGLGLILCKEFVEQNNGSICVKSEEGKGSCFTVGLPDAS